MFSATDEAFMRRALDLAAMAMNHATPNPRVGCVLVRDRQVIAEGFTQRPGEPHAEAHAIRNARGKGQDLTGATAYVTLEPCNHFGKTPPCTEALIGAGVGRVVAAMEDPNPRVSGTGFERLREAGIDVRVGLLQQDATELNIGFIKRMATGLPWVRCKVAASIDGRTGLANGESKWITGDEARRDGHRWRARACAVLTGSGTVKQDNPQMTVRGVSTPLPLRQPLRVVFDHMGELSPLAKVLQGGALVYCSDHVAVGLPANVEVVRLPDAALSLYAPSEDAMCARLRSGETRCWGGTENHWAMNRPTGALGDTPSDDTWPAPPGATAPERRASSTARGLY